MPPLAAIAELGMVTPVWACAADSGVVGPSAASRWSVLAVGIQALGTPHFTVLAPPTATVFQSSSVCGIASGPVPVLPLAQLIVGVATVKASLPSYLKSGSVPGRHRMPGVAP
jgi:hypothetical protein